MDTYGEGLSLRHTATISNIATQSTSGEVHIIDDLCGLDSLRSEWNHIFPAKDVEPWQSFSWIRSAAFAFNGNHSLRIITVRKNRKLSAIAPMVVKPSEQPLRPKQLHIIGAEELKEPNRLIYQDKHSLELLANEIAKEKVYPIRLSRISINDPFFNVILQKLKENGWLIRILKMPYPYIDLRQWRVKKSLKNDLKRSQNKALSFGDIRYCLVDQFSKSNLELMLESLFKIEGSGWKGQNRSAIISNDSRKVFFEKFANESIKNGTLRLNFLNIGNQNVATQYAIATQKAFWLLNIGYDESFRSCSPGNLLLFASINGAIQNGLSYYNLLGKVEPWTQRWTNKDRGCFVISAYRANSHGFRAMLSDALYLARKRYQKRKRANAYQQNWPRK